MKNILCPVDFSEYTEKVLGLAVTLAQKENAQIHIVYVLASINYHDLLVADSYLAYGAELIAQERKESNERMSALKEKIEKEYPGQIFTAEVLETANTEDGILEAAEKIKADCIVIGSHGRRGFSRIILGSVAETILREAKCDVVIYKVRQNK
ncbi:MAG: universal stress protein [Chitinophagales bacterium]|nr:universal stress protein [Chitinophagales bacterium]MDW8272730.1 universal stress protein [Chitinophagales bacterium]